MATLLLAFSMASALVQADPETPSTPVTQHHFTRCIQTILYHHISYGRTVFISLPGDDIIDEETPRSNSSDWNEYITRAFPSEIHKLTLWPLRIYRSDSSLSSKTKINYVDSNDMYVMLCSTYDVTTGITCLKQSLRHLIVQKAWNSRAKMVVGLTHPVPSDLIRNIFKVLWSRHLLNVIVIVPEVASITSFDVYTWYPFKSPQICAEVEECVLIDRWVVENDGYFLFNSNLFPPKIPNDLLGCPFKASTYNNKPYVEVTVEVDPKTNSSIKIYSGLEVKLLRLIVEGMNATLVFQDTPPRNDNMWGHLLNNGTITGIIGDVIYGRTDIAFSSMPKGFDILEAILDSTVSYIDSVLLWYVQCARHRERWESVTRVFSLSLWLLFFLVYVLVALVTWKLAASSKKLIQRESRFYLNMIDIFYTVFGVVVGTSAPEMPRTSRVRIIISCWLWYAFAFNVIFQTFYISLLVDPGILKQVKNVDELLDSKLKLAYLVELDYLYRDSNDVKEQKILSRRTYCVDVKFCLDRAAIKGDLATIANNLDIHYRSNNTHLLCELEDDIFRFNLAMFMAKGNPLLGRIDNIILRLMEAGMLHQWLEEHKEILERDERRLGSDDDEPEDGYFVFAVTHLYMVFGCLVLGLMLSFISFICELLYYKFLHLQTPIPIRRRKTVLFVRVNTHVHSIKYTARQN